MQVWRCCQGLERGLQFHNAESCRPCELSSEDWHHRRPRTGAFGYTIFSPFSKLNEWSWPMDIAIRLLAKRKAVVLNGLS